MNIERSMNIEWSAWTKVSRWLDVGLNADPKVPEYDGVYEFRISPDYGNKLRVYSLCRAQLHYRWPHGPRLYRPYVEGGRVLYVGKSSETERKKENNNFVGLDKRVGAFFMSAMGFGKEHRVGHKFCHLRSCAWDPGDTPLPTVFDLEVRWAVGGCPLCMEKRAFHDNHPRPLFNQTTPKMCGSSDCPDGNRYFPSVTIKVRPLGEGRSL